MDCRRWTAAKSRLHSPFLADPRVLTAAEASRGIRRRQPRRVRQEIMKVTRSLVSVVDDDESVRESLPDLLKEFGFAVRAFSSAQEFLASDCVGQTRCLILDVGMPG